MTLVVFGASGATGRHVVAVARASGRDVRAVVRAGAATSVPDARIEADVLDPASVAGAIRDATAVAVCLGISRRSRSPFAPLVSPPDLTSRAVAAIVAAMRAEGVRRIVHVSAFGVGDSWLRIPWWGRGFIRLSNVRHSLADHGRCEEILAVSGLDWTALRPMMLDDRPSDRPAREMAPGDSLLVKVPREALARRIVATIGERATIGRAVAVTAG
jgi:uncharacterized protein YbjT (DUF2867 family)